MQKKRKREHKRKTGKGKTEWRNHIEKNEAQTNVLCWAMSDNMQSIALVLTPVFTYNKGKLHIEETKIMECLTKGNHNLDWQFIVQFKDKVDERDMRPMVYPGRFVFASPLGDVKKNQFFWSDLRKLQRTQEIPQLMAKQVREVIDLADDALPVSIDSAACHVHGASKHCQLGVNAWQAMISSSLSGVDVSQFPAIVLLDLYPRVGEALAGFSKIKRMMAATSMFYIGVCENQVEETWINKTMIDEMVDDLESGELTLPNVTFDKTMNEDALEPIPPAPQLSRLIIDAESQQLKLPAALLKQYQHHPTFGKEWGAWLDNFILDPLHKIAQESGDGVADKTPEASVKRKGADPDLKVLETPAKKVKMTYDIIETSAITDVLIKEAKMGTGKDQPSVQIRSSHKIFIVNPSLQEWSGTCAYVASFGKGNWKGLTNGAAVPEKGLLFTLTGSEDYVVLNNVVTELGKVYQDQMKTKPDAVICYHKVTTDTANAKKFTLTQTHQICFVPVEQAATDKETTTQNNIASKEDVKHWNSGIMHVLWAVRWTAKGLQPIKPVVHLKGELVIPPGRACLCSGAQPVPSPAPAV